MVVQHNMQAANASRMLNITTGSQGKTTEKLASGYRINRAADDAAGLSISEKMRRQIRGLAQASTNASDGVSAVQTAEGALNEVHSMLQRMNELTVQAANGSNSLSDRQDLQNEITQLTAEIDRISQTTRFNEGYLLKGMETKSKHLIAAHDAGLEGYLTEIEGQGKTQFALTNRPLKNGDVITIAGVKYDIGKTLSQNDYNNLTAAKKISMSAGDTIKTVDGTIYSLTDNVSEAEIISMPAHAGDTITTADGTVYKYYLNGATPDATDSMIDPTALDSNGATWNAVGGTGWYKQSDVEGTIKDFTKKLTDADVVKIKSAGNVYTTGKDIFSADGSTNISGNYVDGAGTVTAGLLDSDSGVHHTIVKELEQNEVSSYHMPNQLSDTVLSKAINGYSANYPALSELQVGDVITVNGIETVANDNNYIAKDLKNVQTEIEELQAGSVVTITDPTGPYNVGEAPDSYKYVIIPDSEKSEENYQQGKLTRSEIIDLIKEGSRVTMTAAEDFGIVSHTGTGTVSHTSVYSGDAEGTLTYNPTIAGVGPTPNAGWYTEAQIREATNRDVAYAAANGGTHLSAAAAWAGISPAETFNGSHGITVTGQSAGDTITLNTKNYTVAGVEAMDEDAISVKEAYDKITKELQIASSIGTMEDARVVNNHDGTFIIEQGSVTYADPLIFDLHVGSEADMTNKIVVQLNSMNATSLGLCNINIADETGMAATYVIDVISDALAKVSAQRAELGAVQNRLEHSIANLDNVVENTEASESRIRDTDMADAMVQYSKNNILAQAGQSMLAQANQATQGVLSLLQ